jgi:CheY-like chemotaxis protein
LININGTIIFIFKGGVMSKKKILIVEDEKDIAAYMRVLFEDNGYETVSAEDGITGIDVAKAEKPDLITLDIAMPNQTGVKTLRYYQKSPELKDIPVVVVTGVGENMSNYFKKVPGFKHPDGFINKPIDEELLVKTINDLLK